MSILRVKGESIILTGNNCYGLIAFCQAVGGKFYGNEGSMDIRVSDTIIFSAALHSTPDDSDYSYYYWGIYDTSLDTDRKILSNY